MRARKPTFLRIIFTSNQTNKDSQITLIKKHTFRCLNIVLLKRREICKYNKFLLKSQNFDEIVVFSAGSEKSSVLWRTRFFGFSEKLKKAQNYDFLIKEFGVFGQAQDSFVRRRKAELFAV